MVSDRKLAANRANAIKSTGPRSAKGKKSVGLNARTHGLFAESDRTATVGEIDKLARELAGGRTEDTILEQARRAAEAEVDLRRVRWARLALIECSTEFDGVERPRLFLTNWRKARRLSAIKDRFDGGGGGRPPTPQGFRAAIPSNPEEWMFEAMSRVIPELTKLEQYEKRIAARRDRAIRQIVRQST